MRRQGPLIKKKAEKRKSERINLTLPLKYKKVGKSFLVKGTTHDISGRGIAMRGLAVTLAAALGVNDQIEISLPLKEKGTSIRALCRVAWCTPIKNGKFKAGLEFLKIREHWRFLEFLCENLIDISLDKE